MDNRSQGFFGDVISGAVSLFVLFMMLAFVVWLVVEYPVWVLIGGFIVTMIVVNYFRK